MISSSAQEMMDTRVGYRDESVYGEGVNDPKEVVLYEMLELNNLDVVDAFIKIHSKLLTQAEKNTITEWFDNDAEDVYTIIEDYFDGNESDFVRFIEKILDRVLDNRNFCVWLCATEEEVFKGYGQAYSNFEECKEHITKYDIPEDAIILSDLWCDGCLWCWKE